MREVKFRAWQPYSKTMYYSGSNFFINIGRQTDWITGEKHWVGYEIRDNRMFASCVYSDSGALMQYTGLKDKNGKEIYEGDILLIEGRRNICIFRGGGFTFQWETEKHRFYHPDFSPESEIIGNIYENPELLK